MQTPSINDQILKDKLNNTSKLPCGDFLQFADLLLRSRKIDDNISHLINTTIPTDSFICEKNNPSKQCELIWQQLLKTHMQRETAIKQCLAQLTENVLELKKKKDAEDNLLNNKNLRMSQNKLRLLRNETTVEEILKNKSTKLFEEKCRNFYEPN